MCSGALRLVSLQTVRTVFDHDEHVAVEAAGWTDLSLVRADCVM